MTDDATLSDFATSETGETDGADEGDDGTDSSTAVSPPEADRDPGSAQSTYAYGEYTCADCGQSTNRVWRADGALVCPDCKQW